MFHRSFGIVLAALLLLTGACAEKPAAPKRFGDVTEARVLAEADSGENWLVNGGRFTGEHFSPLQQITTGNVDQLGVAWRGTPTCRASRSPWSPSSWTASST